MATKMPYDYVTGITRATNTVQLLVLLTTLSFKETEGLLNLDFWDC